MRWSASNCSPRASTPPTPNGSSAPRRGARILRHVRDADVGRHDRAGRVRRGRGRGPGPGCAGRRSVALAVLDAAGIPPEAAEPRQQDGDRIAAGAEVLRISAPLRELLGAERTMLAILTHLSGIATATRAWADALSGTGCAVRDTRKTLPGRPAPAREVRGALRRRPEPPHGPRRRRADQGQPRAGGLWYSAPAIAAVRAAAPVLADGGGMRDTLDQVREALIGPRGNPSCSTTWAWPSCAWPSPSRKPLPAGPARSQRRPAP